MTVIRAYEDNDLEAVYSVCTRTADSGGDATGRYSSDDLMPDIFAGPYLHLEPNLAFVLDDAGSAVGYVIGTAVTASFVRRFRSEWLPRLEGRYQTPPDPPGTGEEQMLWLLFHPEHMLRPELERYPAHLHIDLLAPYRGQGYGRRLIETFCWAVARAGAPQVQVTVPVTNERAIGFYRRTGFTDIDVPGSEGEGVIWLGRSTSTT